MIKASYTQFILNGENLTMIMPAFLMSTKAYYKVYNSLKFVLGEIFPNLCLICNRRSQRSVNLCLECEHELPWNRSACYICAQPLPMSSTDCQQVCGQCLQTPPPFSRSIATFQYHQPVDKLISRFKYHQKLIEGRLLADLLAFKIMHSYQTDELPDMILPVPLHPKRLRARGFNQAYELCRIIAQHLQIPTQASGIVRVINTSPQQELSAQLRKCNLTGAFEVNQHSELSRYQRIAIVDDVVTTATTVSTLAKLLLDSGVKDVHIWSIARA